MAFLCHRSYDISGLASLINVSFWGRRDFQISFSSRDMLRNVRNCLLGNSMLDIGILSNAMKFPSPWCYLTFWSITICSDTLHWSNITRDLVTELGIIIDFDLITKFLEVSIEHLQRVGLASWGRLNSSRYNMYVVLSLFGLTWSLILRWLIPLV